MAMQSGGPPVVAHCMRMITSTIGLFTINMCYLLLGAWVFLAIEAPREASLKNNLEEERDTLVDHIIALGTGPEEYYRGNASEKLAAYELQLANFYRKRATFEMASGNESLSDLKLWSYEGAIIYCYSVITTIGWGNIVPNTINGKLGTVIYGLNGMPLFFSLSSEVGNICSRITYVVWTSFRATVLPFLKKKPPNQAGQAKDKNRAHNPSHEFQHEAMTVFFSNVASALPQVHHQTALINATSTETLPAVANLSPQRGQYTSAPTYPVQRGQYTPTGIYPAQGDQCTPAGTYLARDKYTPTGTYSAQRGHYTPAGTHSAQGDQYTPAGTYSEGWTLLRRSGNSVYLKNARSCVDFMLYAMSEVHSGRKPEDLPHFRIQSREDAMLLCEQFSGMSTSQMITCMEYAGLDNVKDVLGWETTPTVDDQDSCVRPGETATHCAAGAGLSRTDPRDSASPDWVTRNPAQHKKVKSSNADCRTNMGLTWDYPQPAIQQNNNIARMDDIGVPRCISLHGGQCSGSMFTTVSGPLPCQQQQQTNRTARAVQYHLQTRTKDSSASPWAGMVQQYIVTNCPRADADNPSLRAVSICRTDADNPPLRAIPVSAYSRVQDLCQLQTTHPGWVDTKVNIQHTLQSPQSRSHNPSGPQRFEYHQKAQLPPSQGQSMLIVGPTTGARNGPGYTDDPSTRTQAHLGPSHVGFQPAKYDHVAALDGKGSSCTRMASTSRYLPQADVGSVQAGNGWASRLPSPASLAGCNNTQIRSNMDRLQQTRLTQWPNGDQQVATVDDVAVQKDDLLRSMKNRTAGSQVVAGRCVQDDSSSSRSQVWLTQSLSCQFAQPTLHCTRLTPDDSMFRRSRDHSELSQRGTKSVRVEDRSIRRHHSGEANISTVPSAMASNGQGLVQSVSVGNPQTSVGADCRLTIGGGSYSDRIYAKDDSDQSPQSTLSMSMVNRENSSQETTGERIQVKVMGGNSWAASPKGQVLEDLHSASCPGPARTRDCCQDIPDMCTPGTCLISQPNRFTSVMDSFRGRPRQVSVTDASRQPAQLIDCGFRKTDTGHLSKHTCPEFGEIYVSADVIDGDLQTVATQTTDPLRASCVVNIVHHGSPADLPMAATESPGQLLENQREKEANLNTNHDKMAFEVEEEDEKFCTVFSYGRLIDPPDDDPEEFISGRGFGFVWTDVSDVSPQEDEEEEEDDISILPLKETSTDQLGPTTQVGVELAGAAETQPVGTVMERFHVPLFVMYILVIIYVMLGAIVFYIWDEDLDFWDSLYFIYVMLSTTGFGDLLPKPNMYAFIVVYALVGMALYNILINAVLELFMEILEFVASIGGSWSENQPE